MIILIREHRIFHGILKISLNTKCNILVQIGRTYPSDTNTAIYRLRDFFKPHIGILEYIVPDRKNILAYAFLL
jgi:hypothetical protein